MAEPPTDWSGDIHCVTRWSKFGMDWRGVDVRALIERARPDAEASAPAGPLLRRLHDQPAALRRARAPGADRLRRPTARRWSPTTAGRRGCSCPHLYLWKSAKWIQRLEVLDHDQLGFWERNGYHHRGDPWREERYSVDDYVARADAARGCDGRAFER